MTRIPHGSTEVRQGFQKLTAGWKILLEGASGYLLVGAGVGGYPSWKAVSSAVDHGAIGGLGDDDHTHYLLAAGTRALTGNMAVDALVTIDGRDLSVDGTKLNTIEAYADITDATNVAAAGAAMSGGAFHDGFSDSIADEHVAHSGVTLTAGSGLAGGGDITTGRTFDLDINSLATATIVAGDFISFWDITATATNKKTTLTNFEAALTHDNLVSGTIANHDTTATGVNLTSMTDNSMVDTLHRHSELSASDGTPDQALVVDASGKFVFSSGPIEIGDTADSSTIGVILKDSNRFIHNYHNTVGNGAVPDGFNIFLGTNSGNFTTGSTATEIYHGSYNVAVGYSTLLNNTTGYNNMALGTNAMRLNETGRNCAAVGVNALYFNTTGANCVAVGPNASYKNDGGLANIAIGTDALHENLDGNNNVAVGPLALYNNLASNNVAIGLFALRLNTSGSDNAAIGLNCLRESLTGHNNAAIGSSAGRYIANGSTPNEDTDNSVYIGYLTKASADGADNEVVIGYNAIGSGTNTVTLGGSAVVGTIIPYGNVGIGLANPNETLTIEAGVLSLKETSTPTATANYAKLYSKDTNTLWWQDGAGSEHLLHGDSFSNIWFHGASTVEVTISTQSLFTKINSFSVVGHEDDLGNMVGSSASNDLTLSSGGGGEYEISFHASVTATGGADKEMLICLGIILATPKDITDVTDDTITPIVITSVAHGLENGDMVEIVGVLGNTAANGSFIVDSKTDNTFVIVDLDGSATTGNGDFNEGSPTGDVTIEYPGNMIIHREVRGASIGAISATGIHILANSDVLALYVANLDGTTNLTVAAVSLDAFRIGD